MSRDVRDLEVKRGLLGGGSMRARERLLGMSQRNNADVLAKKPGAIDKGRRLGRAAGWLAKRMVRAGAHAPRLFGAKP